MSQSFTLWKSWNHFNLDRANFPQNTSGFSKLNLYKSSCVLMLGTPSNSGKGVVVVDVVMSRWLTKTLAYFGYFLRCRLQPDSVVCSLREVQNNSLSTAILLELLPQLLSPVQLTAFSRPSTCWRFTVLRVTVLHTLTTAPAKFTRFYLWNWHLSVQIHVILRIRPISACGQYCGQYSTGRNRHCKSCRIGSHFKTENIPRWNLEFRRGLC